MLGLGTGEMVLIGMVALLVIGPERLPKLMRQLGTYYGQIRRAADDLRRAFVMEADRQDAEERYKSLQARRKKELEARRAAEEPAGASPAVAAVAESPEGPVPNDVPPDAPHPDRMKAPPRMAE